MIVSVLANLFCRFIFTDESCKRCEVTESQLVEGVRDPVGVVGKFALLGRLINLIG